MPLRFPRPVVPVIATGMAAVWVVAGSAPAFADQARHQEWWLGKLGVSQAWQTSKGHGVTVAVLSDGADATQADLSGSVRAGPDYTSSGETTSTYLGLQGTAVASLIAGHGHGAGHASGIIGVAPSTRILSVRVTLDASDPALASTTIAAGLPDAIAAGIRYAVRHGAKVIDLPLDPGQPGASTTGGSTTDGSTTGGGVTPTAGTTPPPGSTAARSAAAGGSSAEKAAVAYALSKKVVLVAPAGDDGAGTDAPNYPAAYPGVISVGAFDHNFVKAPYSSHRSYVTLTAAGAGVVTAQAGGGYAVVNSTAAASAVVTGIVALIRSRYPGLSPAQVTSALTTSTVYRPTGGIKNGSGHGTVNAERAVAAAAALAAPADERAGAGAVARTRPARPSAEAVSSGGLVPRVLRAAIISAGVLILLLLLIAAYAAVGRRRERKDTAASAEWARSAQNAYSPYGPGDADRMLEFFAAPADDPSGGADQFPQAGDQFPQPQGGRFPADQFSGGQSSATQAVGAGAGGIGGTRAAAGAGAAAGAAAGSRGVGAWVPLGPASRAQGRQQRVSGAPPWEPAAEPDSELPWASVPGPAAAPAAASADIRPAAAASGPASGSVWPRVTSTPAGPTPSGRAWEDLAASSRAAVRAMPEDDLPPPPMADIPSAPPAPPAPESPAPSPSGSLWDAADRPRSPTGTAWETPDSQAAQQPADPGDAHWQQASDDAYHQPAPAEVQWRAADSEGNWQPAEAADAQPADSDAHWLPAAADTQWQPDDQDSRWQPDDNEAQWQPDDNEAPWEPVAAGSPWEPAAGEPRQEPGSLDRLWQPARSDSGWQTGASPQAQWEPDAPEDESSADGDELFAWRPAAQTETFPAVSDDSRPPSADRNPGSDRVS